MAKHKSAESLLAELGITTPEDIKVDAIAQYCGATVVYEPLSGCEAYIAGHGNRAIITVNSKASAARRRFSAAHELGHWIRDRGELALACTERQFLGGWTDDDPERRANRYAADLLLPKAMFRPHTRGKSCTFETVKALAGMFETSLTATAIRLVEEGDRPSMLVCTDGSTRRWYARSDILPKNFWLHPKVGKGALVNQVQSRGATAKGTVDASEWINHPRARDYEVHEDSVGVGGTVLTLLWWENEKMILDLDPDLAADDEDGD